MLEWLGILHNGDRYPTRIYWMMINIAFMHRDDAVVIEDLVTWTPIVPSMQQPAVVTGDNLLYRSLLINKSQESVEKMANPVCRNGLFMTLEE